MCLASFSFAARQTGSAASRRRAPVSVSHTIRRRRSLSTVAISIRPLFSKRAQIARERRLIEARAQGQRAQRVVGRDGDLRHKPELRRAEADAFHVLVEEPGDAPYGQAGVPSGAKLDCGGRIGAKRFAGLFPCCSCIHVYT